jgi:hypothetical protein
MPSDYERGNFFFLSSSTPPREEFAAAVFVKNFRAPPRLTKNFLINFPGFNSEREGSERANLPSSRYIINGGSAERGKKIFQFKRVTERKTKNFSFFS